MNQPRVWAAATEADQAAAGRLLHDFNREYDEPSPPPPVIADRLRRLADPDRLLVLLVAPAQAPAAPAASAAPAAPAAGVAVVRFHASLWSEGAEAYLAELYVVPEWRGHGLGRSLLAEVVAGSRQAGADYLFLITTEEDVAALRAYEAAGFRRTEGEGGPLMVAFEQDLTTEEPT